MSRTLTLRSAISAGLITGAVMIYLVAVGIAAAFAEREVVTGYLTLGRLMLALPALAIGYAVAGRPLPNSRRLTQALAAGLAAGTLFGAAFLAAVALSPGIRTVLNRISVSLLDFVGFRDLGLEPVSGAALNVGLITRWRWSPAWSGLLPSRSRRAIVGAATAVLVMGMVEPFLRPRFLQLGLPARPSSSIDCTGSGRSAPS